MKHCDSRQVSPLPEGTVFSPLSADTLGSPGGGTGGPMNKHVQASTCAHSAPHIDVHMHTRTCTVASCGDQEVMERRKGELGSSR